MVSTNNLHRADYPKIKKCSPTQSHEHKLTCLPSIWQSPISDSRFFGIKQSFRFISNLFYNEILLSRVSPLASWPLRNQGATLSLSSPLWLALEALCVQISSLLDFFKSSFCFEQISYLEKEYSRCGMRGVSYNSRWHHLYLSLLFYVASFWWLVSIGNSCLLCTLAWALHPLISFSD